MDTKQKKELSDREQAGLHGPVKTCREEVPVRYGDGTDGTDSSTTEYDAAGRIIATHGSNPKGMEWSTTREYDAQGRLLRSTANQMGSISETINTYDGGGRLVRTIEKRAGVTVSERAYAYDARGRVADITTKGEMGSHSTFQYDEQGLKTQTSTFDREPLPPNSAFGGDPMLAAQIGHGVPLGGYVKTIYDQHDQPTEAQAYDAAGRLVWRVTAQYDAEGHLLDQRQILSDPASVIPSEVRDQILKESGESLENLREYLANLLGGSQGMFAQSQKYDAQGRVSEARTRMGSAFEQVVSTTYNSHGEIASEDTVTTQLDNAVTQGAPPFPPPKSTRRHEARYEYRYDGFGNWTERTTKSSDNPDDPFNASSTTRRTITYY